MTSTGRCGLLASVFAGMMVQGAATAAVVYDNGSYDESGALEVSRAIGADDFVLASDFTVGGAGLVIRDPDSDPWDGTTLNWYLFADSGGDPGAVIASGAASGIVVTDLGASSFGGSTLLDVGFDLGAGVALSAGTSYWFGVLFADVVGGANSVQWLKSSTDTGLTARASLTGVAGPWTVSAADVNFRLTAASVLEPGSLAMLAIGVGVFGLRTRRPDIARGAGTV